MRKTKKILVGLLAASIWISAVGVPVSAAGRCAGRGAGRACSYYVDTNRDGICDRWNAGKTGKGNCTYFVDKNGDGICDNAGNCNHTRKPGRGCGRGRGCRR